LEEEHYLAGNEKPPAAIAGGGLGVSQLQNFFVRLLFPRANWSR
jgi:hypothetical protein